MAVKKSSVPSDAQKAYTFTGTVAKRRGAAPKGLSSDLLAKLVALYQAGVFDGLLQKRRGAKRGVDLSEVMKLYAKYGPILELLMPLIEKLFKKSDQPVVDAGGDGKLPDGGDEEEPEPSSERVAKRLEAKLFWVTRKRTPYKAGGGRDLLSDAARDRIRSGSDPLQAGDRCCFDVSPFDQDGKKFEGEKPVELEHVPGGVGELQVQEENDYTPVLLCPWEDPNVRPGFQGELTYQAKGGGLTSNKVTLRVRPWA